MRTRFWFSQTEIKHITLSALLVMGVGLSGLLFLGANSAVVLISAALIFAFSFLLHEIAHKLVAQHYGLWAEFRLNLFGALITMISIISPLKIISPGAVMIAGYTSKERIGKTSIIGPSTNIALSIISLTFTFVPLGPFNAVAVYSAFLNAFIAVFNLIPIGMLDGLKVFNWNKLVWSTTFALSMALLILIYISHSELVL
jgi:Zn-dependent protease